ncbi:hypothetical protein [Streptomyces anulatus]|uniref:hypothetical protein n=1 Tax=Streptomyces anulatus TaxID=1892 RepID=UPI003F49E4FD
MPTTPTPADRPADQPRAVLRLLEDAQSYLSVLHGAVGRHDHIGVNLACDGCALRDRITPALAVARQLLGTSVGGGVALTPQGHPGVDLFAALQHAGLDVDEANARMYAYARMVLRQEKATAAPPTPLAEVWTVWREDEPVYAHYTTEADARQGTIDCWQEDEPSCPDYSWRQDGPRLELVVGGERGGVYASRHRVYGAPPAPADRAALTEAEQTMLNYALNQAQLRIWSGHGSHTEEEQAALVSLRRLADAAAGVQPPTSEALTDAERQFLTFAVELAADQMASRGDEFDDEDEAALLKFRALATPPAAPAAPEEPTR